MCVEHGSIPPMSGTSGGSVLFSEGAAIGVITGA
jgi:hypothetical protein